MTAPLYVWYRGAFVAIGTNAHMQEERQKRQKRRIDTIVSFDYVISFLFFQNKKKWSNPKYKSTYQQAK